MAHVGYSSGRDYHLAAGGLDRRHGEKVWASGSPFLAFVSGHAGG
jgi:hypothetical protein